MAEEMLARALPGFVDYRHYVARDGERLSVIWGESAAAKPSSGAAD